MKDLSTLLQKFKNIGFEDHLIKDSLIEIIDRKYNEKITRKEIVFKDGVLIVNKKGPLKTEITLNKQILLEEIRENTKESNKNILDLR